MSLFARLGGHSSRKVPIELFDGKDSISVGSKASNLKKIGSDIPLLNGWVAATEADDGQLPPVLYEQGGRVFAQGVIIAPADALNKRPFEIPAEWNPNLLGLEDKTNLDLRFMIAAGPNPAVAHLGFVPDDFALRTITLQNGEGSVAPDSGTYCWLDGISWALA